MNRNKMELRRIAYIKCDFPDKFGIPRQSGLADTAAEIIFEPEYQAAEAFRGIEEYSHVWLIWGFSEVSGESFKPTVRPPRLGGNRRVGVFATRSPFRPNPVGLSCVKLERLEYRKGEGPVLVVSGADLMDGTPIYDIKPYLPYVDAKTDARGGFADHVKGYALEVEFPGQWLSCVPEEKREALCQVLAQDPRPAYQEDPERIYGMLFSGLEIKFRVADGKLTVCRVTDDSYLEE